MRMVDQKAQKIGLDASILMENAGANAARILNEKISLRGKKILVFCGMGNNGGDGLVFARHALIYGAKIFVYFVKDPRYLKTNEAENNYKILKNLKSSGFKINFCTGKVPSIKADVLVDALLGIGLKGNVQREYKKAIEKFNSLNGFKYSIDCPSGVNSDTGKIMGVAVKPDLTVTFYDKKKGLNGKNSGEIIVADIGIPKIKI